MNTKTLIDNEREGLDFVEAIMYINPVHRTDEIKCRFLQISHVRFRFCAPYSSHLKPMKDALN